MARSDSICGNLSALGAGLVHHQLLHEEGDGAVVLAQEVGARNLGVGGAAGGRVLGRPGVRTQRLRPLLAVRDVVEEEAVGVDGADGAVGLLRRGLASDRIGGTI